MAIKKLQALTFLPAEQIKVAFDELKSFLPDILKDFLKSFDETYVSGRNRNGRPKNQPAL